MIRKALPTDVPAMVALTRFYFPRLKNEAVEFDEHAFTAYVQNFIAEPPGSLALVSEKDGEVAAFILCILLPQPFTGEIIAVKCVWCAHEDAPGHGTKVHRAAEAWARKNGVKRFISSCFDARTERLLSLEGYHEIERSFEKVF